MDIDDLKRPGGTSGGLIHADQSCCGDERLLELGRLQLIWTVARAVDLRDRVRIFQREISNWMDPDLCERHHYRFRHLDEFADLFRANEPFQHDSNVGAFRRRPGADSTCSDGARLKSTIT